MKLSKDQCVSQYFNQYFGMILALGVGLSGCNDPAQPPSPNPTSGPTNGSSLPLLTGANILAVTVNGSICSNNSYPNKPCVSVTVCGSGGSSTTCQTISDILVDTGSYGLRVFKSVLNPLVLAGLKPVTSGGQPLAECVQYGDGSSNWGPVEMAGVILGGEQSVETPIQVIDSTFSNSGNNFCGGADVSPSDAGFNGILGVGFYAQDCGSTCVNQKNNGLYYSCNGTSCTGATVSLSDQVQNPVALLPHDNNGVILELPSVSSGGQDWANGYLVLGIGTQSNNMPSGVKAFPADPSTGEFTTVFNGVTYKSFLDSGSNGIFFPSPSGGQLPDCGFDDFQYSGWFCPSDTLSFFGTNSASSGSVSSVVPFNIGNFISLSNSGKRVFVEAGGDAAGSGVFDWGLPFHLGRNVYVGIQGSTSSLGTGPYWAY